MFWNNKELGEFGIHQLHQKYLIYLIEVLVDRGSELVLVLKEFIESAFGDGGFDHYVWRRNTSSL